MNNEFKAILENIEDALHAALPETSSTSGWTPLSFGTLPEGAASKYIDKLIEPNRALVSLGGKRWRPLLMMLCYKMAAELTAKNGGSPALSEEQTYSITPLVEFVHTASLIHEGS